MFNSSVQDGIKSQIVALTRNKVNSKRISRTGRYIKEAANGLEFKVIRVKSIYPTSVNQHSWNFPMCIDSVKGRSHYSRIRVQRRTAVSNTSTKSWFFCAECCGVFRICAYPSMLLQSASLSPSFIILSSLQFCGSNRDARSYDCRQRVASVAVTSSDQLAIIGRWRSSTARGLRPRRRSTAPHIVTSSAWWLISVFLSAVGPFLESVYKQHIHAFILNQTRKIHIHRRN